MVTLSSVPALRSARLSPAVALAALLLAGCQSPDVGQRCEISWGGTIPAPTPDTIGFDYLENGNVGCDNLVCVVSPSAPNNPYNGCANGQCGYCSKPCVSDKDCYKSETGLVCRQMVLDQEFIATLDPAAQQFLGGVKFSNYCAVPQ